MKRECTLKPFKHVTDFYCYNCHGFGHRAVNCKKPKFDHSNSNSRMFRGTNPTWRRSDEGKNGMRSNIVCYKCNKFGHIAKNYKVIVNQPKPSFGNNAPICQLCNNFGHL